MSKSSSRNIMKALDMKIPPQDMTSSRADELLDDLLHDPLHDANEFADNFMISPLTSVFALD